MSRRVVLLLAFAAPALAQSSLSGVTLHYPGPLKYVYDRATFPAGPLPVALVRADFDADGLGDLATADSSGDGVSVLMAKPHGSFRAPVFYATDAEPDALAAGDLDGDGAPDLAVVSQNCPNGNCGAGAVDVLLGLGDGTFGAAASFEVGGNPQSVAIGDFDGDGRPDLAVVNAVTTITQGPGTVSILLGHGDGTFAPQVQFPAGSGCSAIVAADLDGDARLDLAIVNYVGLAVTHAVVTLKGHGDGSFDAPVSHDVAFGPSDVIAADLDGDGDLDLATANLGANSVSVLLNNGAGGFSAHVDDPAGFGPQALTAADLDGDGRLDLALTTFTGNSGGGSLVILPGLPGGTFGAFSEYQTGPIGSAIVAADVDGDGALDLLAPNQGDSVEVFLGHRDGTLFAPSSAPTANGAAAVATGDFDGDGHADLAVANTLANSFSISLGHGDGSFAPRVDHAAPGGPAAIAVADLNHDSRADLVLANANAGTVSVLRGAGNGSFLTALSFAAGSGAQSLAIADFNRDGNLDVAVAAPNANRVDVLLGNGNGTLQPKLDVPAGPGPVSLVAADFDHDGFPDLAVADGNTGSFGPGKVAWLKGHGDGTFAAPVLFDAGIEAFAVATGDFDGDGNADLAVATNLDVFGFVAVLLGDGHGGFAPQVTYASGRFSVALVVADFDGDKRPDIATANLQDNTVTILRGLPGGTFTLQARHSPGIGPAALVPGHFDADTALDLAVVDEVNALAVFVSP